jgi:hypothetical protein
MSNELENLVEKFLPGAIAEELEEYEKQFEFETRLCPPLARIDAIVRRPLEVSEQEQDHIANCVHCTARVKAFRRERHPSLVNQVKSALGVADEAEQKAVDEHSQTRCEECGRLLRTTWVKKVIDGFNSGRIAIQKLAEDLAAARYQITRGPSRALRYAENDNRQRPFHIQVNHGDLAVSLEETDADELLALVTTNDPQLENRVVHLEIAGEQTSLHADIRLERVDAKFEGISFFPNLSSIKEGLGSVLILVAPVLRHQ